MSAPSRVIASIFALSAFLVATLSGLLAGASATETLLRALPVMILFYLVGFVIGSTIESMITAAREAGAGSHGHGGKPVENSGGRVKDSA
jgi:uncharacterized membrane protein